MQVICNTEDFQITEKTAVTLGKFDGIHKGHQRLLNALLEKEKAGTKDCSVHIFCAANSGT